MVEKVTKYRKKPVVIEAIQWDGNNYDDVCDFVGEDLYRDYDRGGLLIHTLEGDMLAKVYDYIIRGINGEFYPCKPGIFVETYELVD